jgi:hypothetical protein
VKQKYESNPDTNAFTDDEKENLEKVCYAIGDVYFTTNNYASPDEVHSKFGYGTWTKLADGVLKLGSTPNTEVTGSTKISREQLPNVNLSHTHTLDGSTNSAGAHNHDSYHYYGGTGTAPAGTGANKTSQKTSTNGAHTHTLSGTATSSNVYLNGNKTQQDFIPAGITVVGWLRTA